MIYSCIFIIFFFNAKRQNKTLRQPLVYNMFPQYKCCLPCTIHRLSSLECQSFRHTYGCDELVPPSFSTGRQSFLLIDRFVTCVKLVTVSYASSSHVLKRPVFVFGRAVPYAILRPFRHIRSHSETVSSHSLAASFSLI